MNRNQALLMDPFGLDLIKATVAGKVVHSTPPRNLL